MGRESDGMIIINETNIDDRVRFVAVRRGEQAVFPSRVGERRRAELTLWSVRMIVPETGSRTWAFDRLGPLDPAPLPEPRRRARLGP